MKLHIILLAIILIDGFSFFHLVNDEEIYTQECNTVYSDNFDEIHELSYCINLPFNVGLLLSDKIEHIVIYQSKYNIKLSPRFSPLCSDDKTIGRMIQFNDEIFQSIQLRTAFEFKCELQV